MSDPRRTEAGPVFRMERSAWGGGGGGTEEKLLELVMTCLFLKATTAHCEPGATLTTPP